MSETTKTSTTRDYQQTLKKSYNDVDSTLSVNGFLVGKVGRKIAQVISTTTVDNDTATFTFSEDGTTLYVYKIIYTTSAQTVLLSAERIS